MSESSHGRSSTGKAASDIVVLGAVNATVPQNMATLVVPSFIDLENKDADRAQSSPVPNVESDSPPQTPVRSQSAMSHKEEESPGPPSGGPNSYALSRKPRF